MSDHLIAEANRHAMALPTTQPTHADIAWYVREVSELRAILASIEEDGTEEHNAAVRLRQELAAERQKARVLRETCESICEEWGRNHDANPIGAGQRMETLASKALEDMEDAE